jgi:hypothetical protein
MTLIRIGSNKIALIGRNNRNRRRVLVICRRLGV